MGKEEGTHMIKVEEIWKQYTFEDGTRAMNKGYYGEWEDKRLIMRHGEIVDIRDAKVRSRNNDK